MDPKLFKKKVVTTEFYKVLEDDDDDEILYTKEKPYTAYATSYPVPGQPPRIDSEVFMNNVASYFKTYSDKIGRMINETTGSEDALSAAEEDLFKDIWLIGTLVRPYYSAEFSEKFTQLIRAFALAELQVVGLVRAGLDIKTWTDFRINNLLVNDIGILLNTFNNFWNQQSIRNLWTQITNAWTLAVKAKQAKDQINVEKNIAQAESLLNSFASVLAQGVINQRPDAFFTKSLTA